MNRDPFYAWDDAPAPKRPRLPRDDYQGTIRLMLWMIALLALSVGGIVWAML